MTDINLEGKVAIVTGGGRGIGEAIVRALHSSGARIVIADITGDEEILARELGDNAIPMRADVTDEESVKALIATTISDCGRLDILCNNAGIDGEIAPTGNSSADIFDTVISVNLRGVFLGMLHGIPAMLQTGGGSIINTASGAAFLGLPGLSSYCASKAGVLGLTRSAAVEYGKAGIRVNAICPGIVRTPILDAIEAHDPGLGRQLINTAEAQTPMGRIGDASEIGPLVAFLASDSSTFMTGSSIVVDGGLTIT